MSSSAQISRDLSEREVIVESLRFGNGVSSYGELLACYPTHDGWYYVDYVFSEGTIDRLNLTDREKRVIKDEEELQEVFETPEEAADFYLRVRGEKEIAELKIAGSKKRTLKEKITKTSKNVFFE